MGKDIEKSSKGHVSPFERIRRANEAGGEYWSSRDFAAVLEYGDYRNFEAVVKKAKLACFNSGHRVEDHFVDVNDMIAIGSDSRLSTLRLSTNFFPPPHTRTSLASWFPDRFRFGLYGRFFRGRRRPRR